MRYRKKPVVIEAVRFNKTKWLDEISQAKKSESFPRVLLSIISGFSPVIETLEGDMKVNDGDYIIKGVQGEFYPCKPDIFLATYEKVEEEKNTGYFTHGGTWVENIPDDERWGNELD
ncbi:hypothetical protein A5880_002386 [Enterococcus sp. 4G2_DIV0659]|uniref:Uncharacterized protein n=1 Tax=Candidatus Enterococcus mansonii TaxID=1834181 RepID=A0A242CHG7_9ENTE|nr:hypothetical protein [Enterococcus sp. 4G2_DIV0659]OTO09609.1 hypothetical protein A5880_000288 [Enterococcus sp. 4G2_DIV0659]